jgi:hypothetical protein
MPASPDPPDLTSASDTAASFCFADRPNPAALIYIACTECSAVISLAESVRSVLGAPVCWDCGVLSLRDQPLPG